MLLLAPDLKRLNKGIHATQSWALDALGAVSQFPGDLQTFISYTYSCF